MALGLAEGQRLHNGTSPVIKGARGVVSGVVNNKFRWRVVILLSLGLTGLSFGVSAYDQLLKLSANLLQIKIVTHVKQIDQKKLTSMV